MRTIHGKKAVVDMMMEFVIAVVILMIVWLLIKVAIAMPNALSRADIDATGTFESAQVSITCDYWLMNFLRAENPDGMTYADLLSYAVDNPDYKKKFETQAGNYFTENYKRGLPLLRWAVSAETSAFVPIASVSSGGRTPMLKCSQKTASLKGPIAVTLGVDY